MPRTPPSSAAAQRLSVVLLVSAFMLGLLVCPPASGQPLTQADPTDPDTFTALSPPIIAGVARVGSTLVASPPQWSDEGVSTTYQWLRQTGQPIAGAQTNQLTLTTADLSHRIFVRATGQKIDRPAATVDSALTAKVVKIPPTLIVTGRSPKVGQITLTVKVNASGEPPLGGTAWVKQGSTLLRSQLPIINGQARFSVSKVKSGIHTYTVFYRGTTRVASATESIGLTTKAKTKPTITLAGRSTPNKVTIGITVRAAGEGPLGGSVSVNEGRKTLESGIKIRKGRATWSATGIQPGTHTYRIGYGGTTQVSTGSKAVTVKVPAPVKLVSYAKCANLQKVHPHGVGRKGAKDKTSGTPVTNFLVSTSLYQRNDGQSPRYTGEHDLDRDNDGIACEKR